MVSFLSIGLQGWSHAYNFGKAELSAALGTLLAHASDGSGTAAGKTIDLQWFKFVCEELIYGAHICDEWDRMLIQAYVGSTITSSLFEGVLGGYRFRDSTQELKPLLAEFMSVDADGSSPLDRTSGVTPLIQSQLEVQRGIDHISLLSRVKLSPADQASKVPAGPGRARLLPQ